MTRIQRGALEMIAAMTISGTVGWVVLVSHQPLADLIFWRCAFGALTLAVVCAAMGLFRGHWSWRMLGWSTLGGLAIVTNWWLIFASFSYTSISIATAVYHTQPFMLVIFGVLLLRDQVKPGQLVWLGLAFAGVLLIAQSETGAGPAGTRYGLGVLMALGAAFFYAVAAISSKRLSGTPPQLIALIQVSVGVLMTLPFANLQTLPTGTHAWSALVAMGVVYTGLVYILLYGAIQKLPTPITAALSFIYPVVAFAVDYWAFDQQLQTSQLLGAGAILLAAAGTTLGWSFKRRVASEPALVGSSAAPAPGAKPTCGWRATRL